MRPDEILDVFPSKSSSIFETYRAKNQNRFATCLRLSAFCIVLLILIILPLPSHSANEFVLFFLLLLFLSIIGLMFCTTFFKFLATHHERNIDNNRDTTYQLKHNKYLSWVYFFASTLIFAIIISLTIKLSNNYTKTLEWGSAKNLAISLLFTIRVVIGISFCAVALKGAYHWALHLDHKIRTATNYKAHTRIILPRFLILLSLSLPLIFDNYFNNHQIISILEHFVNSCDRDWRMLIGFYAASLVFNYLVFIVFSLFLWIHTIKSYKNKDAANI